MKPQLLLVSGAAAFVAAQQDLPRVKLPYGTWQAAKYDKANDVNAPETRSSTSVLTLNRYTPSKTSASARRPSAPSAGPSPHRPQQSPHYRSAARARAASPGYPSH